MVAEFIKQHGFSAQNCRRTETGYSSGVRVKQIQQHLYANYPELKEHKISLTTIRRMFQAPNKHLKAASRYKALINARVRTRQNSYREFYADPHYFFARKKISRALRTLLSDKISVVSVDDMAKAKVGVPAVSRYHQGNRSFPEKDDPLLSMTMIFSCLVILSRFLDTCLFKMKKKLMYHTMKATVTQLKLYPVPNQIFKK